MVGLLLGAVVAWLLAAPAPQAMAAPAATPAAATGGPVVQAPVYVGMRVCIASRTGYRCGTVTAVNQTVCFPDGCMFGLVRTNIPGGPGDAGAYVYNGSGAFVGTVVGGNASATWFDPI